MTDLEICAELGSLHKRSPALLYEMVRQSSKAGAHIAKIQLGWPQSDELRYVDDLAADFVGWCVRWGIEPMASIWSEKALALALELDMPRLKVAHQLVIEQAHKSFVEKIINAGKPVFLSGHIWVAPNVMPIYVQSEYPVFRPSMPTYFKKTWWYGYSSHAHGIADALVAIARGAMYIEKHVCLDRELWTKDAGFAITFEELSQLCALGKEMVLL